MAGSALSLRHVIFKVGIASRYSRDVLYGVSAQRRSAEIRMKNGARRVDERIEIEFLILEDPCFRSFGNCLRLKNGCVEFLRLSVFEIKDSSKSGGRTRS